MTTTYVALLRGINVGGKNKLPMAALKQMFAEVSGCENVRSYIQSGNVVFTSADAKLARRMPALITEKIQDQFGFAIPIIIRSARELKAVVHGNPFLNPTVETRQLAVAFLSKKPTKPALARLDPNHSPGDEFAVVNKEVYLNMPSGAAKTKLTNAYFDRALDCVCTARNWNTTTKLLALAAE